MSGMQCRLTAEFRMGHTSILSSMMVFMVWVGGRSRSARGGALVVLTSQRLMLNRSLRTDLAISCPVGDITLSYKTSVPREIDAGEFTKRLPAHP